MKNSSDAIGNRTRDLPTCSAVPQPTAQLRASPPEIITLVTMVTTLYITSLAPLSYSTASVSLPIPLSAANRLSCSMISVSSGSPKLSWQWNLGLAVQSLPQLTPTIALSLSLSLSCTNNIRLQLIPSSWYTTFFRPEVGGSRLLGNVWLFVLIYTTSNLGRKESSFRIVLLPWTLSLAAPILSCNLPCKVPQLKHRKLLSKDKVGVDFYQ